MDEWSQVENATLSVKSYYGNISMWNFSRGGVKDGGWGETSLAWLTMRNYCSFSIPLDTNCTLFILLLLLISPTNSTCDAVSQRQSRDEGKASLRYFPRKRDCGGWAPPSPQQPSNNRSRTVQGLVCIDAIMIILTWEDVYVRLQLQFELELTSKGK